MSLQIQDGDGPITVAIARTLFEEWMKHLINFHKLDTTWVTFPGFSGYNSPDTHNLFVGFALGLRGFDRLCRAHHIGTSHMISTTLQSIQEKTPNEVPEIQTHPERDGSK